MKKDLTFEEAQKHQYSWQLNRRTGCPDDDLMALFIAEDVYNAITEIMGNGSYTLDDHDSMCNKVAMTLIRMTEFGKTLKSERLKFVRTARNKIQGWI